MDASVAFRGREFILSTANDAFQASYGAGSLAQRKGPMASFALVPYAVAQKTGGRVAGAPARYVIVRRFWHRIDTNKARASPELKDTTTQDTHVPSSASGGDAKPVPSGGKHTLDTSLSHDVTDDEPSSKRSKMHLDESVA